jgi:hypothetical protein
MFDNYELTLIRVEGLGDVSACNCNFFVDDRLHESHLVGDLESSQQVLTVPSKGEMKIRIEDQSLIASLQFPLNIIKCQGYHWLPLFTGENDIIDEVPEEVGLPRILLIFQSRKFLSPVIEITETSEVSENVDPPEFGDDNVKNIEMRMKIIELEQALQFEKINHVQTIERITKDFKVNIDRTSFELEKFRIWSEKYKEKCILLEEQLASKAREVKIFCEEKDFVVNQLEVLREENRKLMKTQEMMEKELEDKENLLKKKCSNQDFKIENLDNFQVSVSKIIKTKTKLINQESSSNSSVCEKKITGQVTDWVDYYLHLSLKDLKLEGFFQKTTETFYRVGCKRVGLVLKNKNVYCKQGDTFKTLENYIFSHLSSELESFIKKRAINKPEHKRFKSFSGSLNDFKPQESKTLKIENPALHSSLNLKKSMTPSRGRVTSTKKH